MVSIDDIIVKCISLQFCEAFRNGNFKSSNRIRRPPIQIRRSQHVIESKSIGSEWPDSSDTRIRIFHDVFLNDLAFRSACYFLSVAHFTFICMHMKYISLVIYMCFIA